MGKGQGVRVKKVPMRQCMGCSERRPKRELLRVVRTPEGEVDVDPTGKRSGRGAYICPDKECLGKAIKSKRLERSLEVAISPEVWQKLEQGVEHTQ